MSPYQQDVIDTTLAEFDVQAQKGFQGIAAASNRQQVPLVVVEKVCKEQSIKAASDRNRAGLQAQLLQQGFGQAQQLAQQNMMNQLGLGSAQQGFLGQDVGALINFRCTEPSISTSTIICSTTISTTTS